MFELIIFQTVLFVCILILLYKNKKLRDEIKKIQAEKNELEDGLEIVARALRATSAVGYDAALQQGYFPQLPKVAQNIVECVYNKKVVYKVRRCKENSPFK